MAADTQHHGEIEPAQGVSSELHPGRSWWYAPSDCCPGGSHSSDTTYGMSRLACGSRSAAYPSSGAASRYSVV